MVKIEAEEIVAILFDENTLQLIPLAQWRLELDLDFKIDILGGLSDPRR